MGTRVSPNHLVHWGPGPKLRDMKIPTSIIWLEDGGWILRYVLGGKNGRIPADLGLLSGSEDALDLAIRALTSPGEVLWEESDLQNPDRPPAEAEDWEEERL